MRQKLKASLLILTAVLVLLLVAMYGIGIGSIAGQPSSAVYNSGLWGLAAAAIFGGPVILVVLAFLWLLYAFYPSLLRSLKGAHHQTASNAKTSDRSSAAATFPRYLSFASVITTAAGLLLLLWFVISGGPNGGMPSHIFRSAANPYLDMQVGLIGLVLGTLLAAINHYYLKAFRAYEVDTRVKRQLAKQAKARR